MYEKNQQTTLRISAQQLTLNFYGFTLVFIQTTQQPSPSVNPESDSGSSSPAATNESQSKLFPRITKAAYDAGKAEMVDNELRSASVSAPKLVKCIRTNEALGYLDTQNMTSRDFYKLLNDCYHLPFSEDNFRKYRAK